MKKRTRRKIFALLKMAGLAVALVAGVFVYEFLFHSPLSHDVSFVVNRGDSVSGVASRLARDGIIDSARAFKTAVRMNGGAVQSGSYDIRAGTGAFGIARTMAHGDVAATTVVIPEGLTIKQIKEQLLRTSGLTGPVECEKKSDAPVCNLHDGDIFPDTYRIARGTSRLALLELARKKMAGIEQAWRSAGSITPVPLNGWRDVVTLASIVQKETPRESEMPVVASVYLNRLRKNMRLQADPTVVYAITDGYGDMRGAALLRDHLKVDSPYNTYAHGGLPPAPIANVGRAALRAVMKPADTNYLFFVADGRGGHRFSNTYEEHLKNQADWRAIKKIKNGG